MEKIDYNEPDCSIDVGFCFYEDSLDTVRRAIDSVKDHVRYIFAIDGKFKFLDHTRELSTPDVREYLESVSNVILIDSPNLMEADKRQKYMELCYTMKTDALIILDSDEWVTDRTDWPFVLKYIETMFYRFPEPKIYGCNTQFPGTDSSMPRVWIKPQEMAYTKCHNFWKFSDGSIWKSTLGAPIIPKLFLRSNDKYRTPENISKTFDYQKKLMAYEKPFKKNYRLSAKG